MELVRESVGWRYVGVIRDDEIAFELVRARVGVVAGL
jgi:hypothetical protein